MFDIHVLKVLFSFDNIVHIKEFLKTIPDIKYYGRLVFFIEMFDIFNGFLNHYGRS